MNVRAEVHEVWLRRRAVPSFAPDSLADDPSGDPLVRQWNCDQWRGAPLYLGIFVHREIEEGYAVAPVSKDRGSFSDLAAIARFFDLTGDGAILMLEKPAEIHSIYDAGPSVRGRLRLR